MQRDCILIRTRKYNDDNKIKTFLSFCTENKTQIVVYCLKKKTFSYFNND